MNKCPCFSGREYAECCQPVIEGEKLASSPEELMRARYSAHAKGENKFLVSSLHSSIRSEESQDEDQEKLQEIKNDLSWDGLEVVETSENGDIGEVDFIARYSIQKHPQQHREKAKFVRENGEWFYFDGEVEGHVTYRRENPKVGRNDPCPCGSGKKYKKCCAA